MFHSQVRHAAIGLTLLLLLAAGCASDEPEPSAPEPAEAGDTQAEGSDAETQADGEAESQEPLEVQDISVCTPTFSHSFSHMWIAQQQGYYEDLGLNVSIEQVQGGPCAQALASDNVDFAGTPNAVDSIMEGLPYLTVFVTADRLSHQFVVSPDIEDYEDLVGSNIATSGPGGLTERLSRTALEDHGLNPDTDATYVSVGRPDARQAAMLSGSVDASMLSPQETLVLVQEHGFHTLPFEPTGLSGPIVTSLDLLESDPDVVARFVKGTLMGHLFYANRRDEALPMVMDFLGSTDEEYQAALYDIELQTHTASGSIDDDLVQSYIDEVSGELGVTDPPPSEEVFDFELADRAYEELQSENWEVLEGS